MGPAPFVSKDGSRYYVLFVDDYTRYTWVYFMSHRSQLLTIYRSFVTMVRTQFSAHIQIFRSDSGGEFTSQAFRSFLSTEGTLPQLSCPGAHAQNGVAERKHRHILETTRALLLGAFVPPHFWAEAVSTAVYLINLLPSPLLHDRSPGECLHGAPPRYDHLRVFGCRCYVLLPTRERTKLTAQSAPCVFLGYSLEHKGYRCYDPVVRRIRYSRDVTFDESTPFYTPSSSTESHTPSVPLPFLFTTTPLEDVSPVSTSPSTSSSTPPASPSPVPPEDPPPVSLLESSETLPPRHPPVQVHYHRRTTQTAPLMPAPPVTPPAVDLTTEVPTHSYSLRDRSTIVPPNRFAAVSTGVSGVFEPGTYREAAQSPEWCAAMSEELDALARTQTWELVPLPSHAVPITCRWIYKVKTRSDGTIERLKARLVARGFQQEYGRDYEETFAPVAHMHIVRTLVAVAAARGWTLSQLDVKNAFLHGDLHEEVYMTPPPGLQTSPGLVCRLRRALYGLKQAPRAWFERFSSVIEAAGFTASIHDSAMFTHTSTRGRTVLLLYVDDMILTGDDPAYISFVKQKLCETFLMTDLGHLRYFLGIEVTSDSRGYRLSQHRYTLDLIARSGLTDTRTVATPMELHLQLRAADGTPLSDPTRYRHLVGSLVYLTVTRPDISHAVHILSQFVSAPTSVHYGHLLRVLRYLRGTASCCLFYSCQSALQLQAYSDATWASSPDDRHSVSGFCVFLGSSLIAWKSKKQTTVASSSVEAELRALAATIRELIWLRWILQDLGVSITSPTPLHCDSTGALQVAADPVKHELSKHVGVDAHFARCSVRDQIVSLHYLPFEVQIADFFTKAQTRAQHQFLLSKLKTLDPP